ncbi:MAG: hypothetical protein ACKOJF_27955 [Planctomycetaceae bacterium]
MSLTEVDRDLLQRCVSGSPTAWRGFVSRFLGLFVEIVRQSPEAQGLKLSETDLDEHCAEIFLTIAQHDFQLLRDFRGESSLATYLCVVARRVVQKLIQAKDAGSPRSSA